MKRNRLVLAGALVAGVASSAGCGSCGDKGGGEAAPADGGFGVSWDGGGRHRRLHGRGRFADQRDGEAPAPAPAPQGSANPVDAAAHPD